MSTFGAHGSSRTITLKFDQKMQNLIVINIQEENDNIFFAVWALVAIQKVENCHFSQISDAKYAKHISK